MIGYNDIAAVIRQLDADAEEFNVEVILAKVGIDEAGVTDIALQRALRNVMISRGIPLPKGKANVPISKNDPAIVMCCAGWLDGFLTGLRLAEDLPQSSHRRSGR